MKQSQASSGFSEKKSLDDAPKLGWSSVRLLFRLFGSLGAYRYLVWTGNLLCVINVASDMAIVSEIGKIMDRDDLLSASLFEILGWLILYCVINRVFGYSQFSVTVYASNRAVENLRKKFFEKLQSMPKKFYDEHKSGWLVARNTGDMGTINEFVTASLMMMVVIVTLTIFACIQMLRTAPILMLPAAIFLPLAAWLFAWFRKYLTLAQEAFSNQNSTMVGYLAETVRGIRVVQAFGREQLNKETYAGMNQESLNLRMSAARYSAVFLPSVDFIGMFGIVSVMSFGAYLIHIGYKGPDGTVISAGQLASFILYMNLLLNPIRMLVELYALAISASVSARRVFELIDMPLTLKDPSEPKAVVNISGCIEFKNITFSYAENRPAIFSNLNLKIEAGESVALVGATGSGKTTLANLAARFMDPNSGTVLLDGIDVKDFKQEALHSHMGIVLQEGFLFTGTVLDNIRFRRPNLGREETVELCRRLGTHNSIRALPDSYDTIVHEGGNSLSVGQRQIISLSRALAADPRVLILDEATSAIDIHTERILDRALSRLIKGRTTLLIAHRLSTVRNANRILVIGEGGILEQGSHQELVDKKGHYYRLLSAGDALDTSSSR